MMTRNELPYRRNVGIMLLNREGLVFMGRRRRDSGPEHVDQEYSWQMPQGGIDEGEEPYAAALRELYEETNINSVSLFAEVPGWLTYDLPESVSNTVWNGRYRGQTQKWFALRFDGEDSEINIFTPAGGHKPEFDDWRWTPIEEITSLIIPFKKNIYEQVVQFLTSHKFK